MRFVRVPLVFVALLAIWLGAGRSSQGQQNPHGVLPIAGMADPFLLLLHDPVVHDELKLTASQRVLLGKVCAGLDGDLWITRNQPPAQGDEIRQRLKASAQKDLNEILTAEQLRRLAEIERRTVGVKVFQRDDMVRALALEPAQKTKIQQLLKESDDAVAALMKASAGKPQDETQAEFARILGQVQNDIWSQLNDSQRKAALAALGPSFDASKLGRVLLRAPEFSRGTAWINSDPLTLRELRGEVVVVFVFAHGCINCIRNYPWYLGWQRDFADRDLKIIGVHTPETDAETKVEGVIAKVKENGFEFPVVVDNDKKIWNAWGNSMWPSTYLIDRRGFVRAWWLGELNWQDQPGEKMLRAKIEELLAEK